MQYRKAIIYPKGSRFRVSLDFMSYEFECPCKWKDCNKVVLTEDIIESLQDTRTEFDDKIIISSGYRCGRRNSLIGGSENSSHPWGDGIDMVPKNGDLDRLEKIARVNFKYVKRYEKHIHADNRLNVSK